MPKQGNTTAGGWGWSHQQERERWKPEVNAGLVNCCRCGQQIDPYSPWDLDHTDDRTGYRGPAHRHCNRRAGAIKGNKQRNRAPRRPAVPRRWEL
jgi:hypothetical protein